MQLCASWCTNRHRPETAAEFRTMQLGLCSKHRDPMPSRYCTSCFGCQSSSRSHTNWQHVHSGLPALSNHGTYCNRTIYSSAIPLLVQPLTRTDFSRHAFQVSAPSGTRCCKVLSSDCQFLNLGLKLFCLIKHLLYDHPTCRQHL